MKHSPHCYSKMQNSAELQKTKEAQLNVREALTSKREHPKESASISESHDSDEDEVNFDARMRQQIIRKKKELGDFSTKQEMPKGELII